MHGRRLTTAILVASLALLGCSRAHDSEGRDLTPGPIADAAQFCADRSFWECRREEFTGRLTADEAAECYRRGSADACDAATWPEGCGPTEDEVDACIDLLQDGDLIDISTPELLEAYDDCDLCP